MTFYVQMVATALEPLNCIERTPGEFYMYNNPSQQCFTGAWMQFVGLFGAFLLLYVIILPISIFVVLNRNRRNQTPQFMDRYGPLVISYKSKYYWYELVEMLKKILFIGVLTFIAPITSQSTRLFLACAVLFFSLVSIIILQ
jgi:hypothetical protein